MKLNLPIYEHLADCQTILIAGAGGGFDIFAGLPIFFALREAGKDVHLANYSFTDLLLASHLGEGEFLLDDLVYGARGKVAVQHIYHPEGYLAQWFMEAQQQDVTLWMLAKSGVAPLITAYQALLDHLKPDAIILVDGGVDSLMRGDESRPGTLLEDSISLAAIDALDIPVKLLTCLGFGAEAEEGVCHHHALENIAALAKDGGFYGSCALVPQMEAFQQYEAACRYVWEQPKHHRSHISTRVIPAAHGEFDDFHMYPEDRKVRVFISPLMSLYWFFDAEKVIARSLIVDALRETESTDEAFGILAQMLRSFDLRPRRPIPY